MDAIEGEPLDSLALWYRYVYGDGECFDPSYETAIERYSNPEWDQEGTNNGSKYFQEIRNNKRKRINTNIFYHFQEDSGISFNAPKLVHS